MFDHRLGLALGKSIREIRALPYPEYLRWQLFYSLEPFGFANDEFRFSAIMAQIHNTKAQKQSQLKKVTYWMRDMVKAAFSRIEEEAVKQNQQEPDLSTPEGREEATKRAMAAFEKVFGGSKKTPDRTIKRRKNQ